MIEGYLDACTADGFFEGWARFERRREACIISIRLEGEEVGRAVADEYRADLLAAKIGHGHYGFRARLRRPLEPGRHVFTLVEERTGMPVWNQLEFPLEVPPVTRSREPITVERLMTRRTEWTDAEVLANLDSLGLDDACARMGVERFIDVTYMWVLGRRVDEEGALIYVKHLTNGLTAHEFSAELIKCNERLKCAEPLSFPTETKWPY